MSDGGTGEKTEEPTPERLRKLRTDGNVPKSQDVTMAVSFLVTFAVIAASMQYMSDILMDLIHISILAINADPTKPGVIAHRLLLEGLRAMGLAIAPPVAAAFVIGIAGNVAQVGFMFTMKPLTPDLNKINPVNGIKNMFNMKKLVETGKTMLKFGLAAYLSYTSLQEALRDVVLIIRVGQ